MISLARYERALERYGEMLDYWKRARQNTQADRIALEAAREALVQRNDRRAGH